MPLSISVPDTLRKSVESASGGKVTVLYTVKGQASYMAVIPKFTIESIDPAMGAGTHPMFVVGGVDKAYRYIGLYPGVIRNGELLSLPGEDPANAINFDTALATARANGAGWGLMTNADWAGIGHTCWKNGMQPRGNTDYGRSIAQASERGVDAATGLIPAATGTVTTRTRTGSGPAAWRHDLTAFGIADLCGNVLEWSPGMRVNNNEVQIITGNDAALNATDMSVGSLAWKAIDGATGALVAPGSAGVVKYDIAGTADYTLVRASGATFEGMTNPSVNPVGTVALQLLKQHGLYPVASTGLSGDGFWLTLTGERLPLRSGDWGYGLTAGVFALVLTVVRTIPYANVGCRPAFVA
jgi:hypothetical protein